MDLVIETTLVGPTNFQALVYDILPSTATDSVLFSYAIGSRKLSANEQFFDGAQTVVSLLQTTQIKQGVSLYSRHWLQVYTSTNKTTIQWISRDAGRGTLSQFHPGWIRLMFTCVLCYISTRTFRRALKASLDSCAEPDKECSFGGVTKSGRVWSGREGAGKQCWECASLSCRASTAAIVVTGWLRHGSRKTINSRFSFFFFFFWCSAWMVLSFRVLCSACPQKP